MPSKCLPEKSAWKLFEAIRAEVFRDLDAILVFGAIVSGIWKGLSKKKFNGYEILKNREVYQFREEEELRICEREE